MTIAIRCMRPKIWSFEWFYTEIVELGANNDRIISWSISQSFIPESMICDLCGKQMPLITDKSSFGTFRCKSVS